jgi:lipoprotein-releasing system ATP-binding protein
VFDLNDRKLSRFRNEEIGFVFQFHQLLPEFTALENVCLPAYIAGLSPSVAERRALELLQFLKVDHRRAHKPSALSGGEQQRVAVARALINDPSVVFADEPSGNLDSRNADDLHQLFFELRDQFGQTFVIVTHNQTLANMADRKLEIVDGILASN